MGRQRKHSLNTRVRQAVRKNPSTRAQSSHLTRKSNPRNHLAVRDTHSPFAPPEDWYEPRTEDAPRGSFEMIIQPPGPGYVHILSEQQVRDRLAEMPKWMTDPLDVVQMSRMTRKKQTFLCYGMQWGSSVYLYPLEESLVETFYAPPRPALYNESRMYGGVWKEYPGNLWTLTWSHKAIEDFYLNNILIHELGHLLDERNNSYKEREQYAEWFAIEHGYRATGGRETRDKKMAVRRRHHAV